MGLLFLPNICCPRTLDWEGSLHINNINNNNILFPFRTFVLRFCFLFLLFSYSDCSACLDQKEDMVWNIEFFQWNGNLPYIWISTLWYLFSACLLSLNFIIFLYFCSFCGFDAFMYKVVTPNSNIIMQIHVSIRKF